MEQEYLFCALSTFAFVVGMAVGLWLKSKFYSQKEKDLLEKLKEERKDNYRLEEEKSWLEEELAKWS